jgi:hypothetical protein
MAVLWAVISAIVLVATAAAIFWPDRWMRRVGKPRK